jgi:hypothetical protein
MGNKRVSRTDDFQYWNDPDYEAALADLGVSESANNAESKMTAEARGNVPDGAPHKTLFDFLVLMPLQLMEHALMAIWVIFKFLGIWASATPFIWIFNLLFRTHIPGIEQLIFLVLGLNHPVWWWRA